LPGAAYITTTSLTVSGAKGLQDKYVNASEIPYIVMSGADGKKYGVKWGDVVAVYRPKTGKLAYAVAGDCCGLGEASVRLHQDIGNDPLVVEAGGAKRAKRGIGDAVYFVMFRGVHSTPTQDSAAWRKEIDTLGANALAAAGGMAFVKKCAASR